MQSANTELSGQLENGQNAVLETQPPWTGRPLYIVMQTVCMHCLTLAGATLRTRD